MKCRVLIAGVAAALTASSAGAAVAPSLRLVTRSPLVVSGAHFRAGERVTVTAGDASVVVHAGRDGVFRANLGPRIVDPCSLHVVAVGTRGDKATLLAARAMCAPASTA